MLFRTVFAIALCAALPVSASVAYTISSTDQFGTVNLSTGAFTFLGNTDAGATPVSLAGLGEVGGALYGASLGSDTLYSINVANGALTTIGVSGVSYDGFGSTLTTLYAMDSSANLYSVNPLTGAWTLIGSTGLVTPGTSSFSTNSSTLYFAEFDAGYKLYTINTSTGLATLVGSTGTPIGALMWDGASVLYGVQDSPSTVAVDALSTVNGAVSVGPAIAGMSGNDAGLAPILTASTPEPGTWLLLGAGIAMLLMCKGLRAASVSAAARD